MRRVVLNQIGRGALRGLYRISAFLALLTIGIGVIAVFLSPALKVLPQDWLLFIREGGAAFLIMALLAGITIPLGVFLWKLEDRIFGKAKP